MAEIRDPHIRKIMEERDRRMAEVQEGFVKELYDGYDTKEEWLEAHQAKMKAKMNAENEKLLRNLFGQ